VDGSRVRDLRLFWKLLLPFLALIVIFGSLGAFLIVRDLSARAQDALDQDLARRSFEARSVAHDRELYLVESANFATNIQGMPSAIAARDAQQAQNLLGSVLALKGDVQLLVATDARGRGLVELRRSSAASKPVVAHGESWSRSPFIAELLKDKDGQRRAGFVQDHGRTMFVIAAPICPAAGTCRPAPAGAAIVGISTDQLIRDAAGASRLGDEARSGAAIYDATGRLLGTSGLVTGQAPSLPRDRRLLRRRGHVKGADIVTLYVPFDVQGQRVGTLAVMLGVIAVGTILSRSIMAQLRPLVVMNRALGMGDLSARTPVVSNDELGELATGVNQMAEQLEALYDSLELRVAQRTDEIERLLQDRTDFFASVSHDLRTPLAVIRSQAMMLRSHKFGDRSPMEVAETIVASSNQLLALINELLELSRAEAGRLDLDLEPVRLKDVVKDLRRTLDGLAQSGGLKISVSIPRDLPPVLADARRLREILLNLVDNAVKYTPSGGKVSVAATQTHDSVTVFVHDNGIGIPEEARAKIFEPFYRVRGNQPQRGQASTGLGLALTKRVVEAQGGEVSFESTPGAGSTFVFTLRTFVPGQVLSEAAAEQVDAR